MAKPTPSIVRQHREQQSNSFSVRLDQDIARGIDSIAARRQIQREALINEILKQYIVRHAPDQVQNGSEFLLSLAGMFDSGANAASENVEAIVTDFILEKHKEASS